MKTLINLLALFIISSTVVAQPHKDKCKIEVEDVSVLTTFGYLNYTVKFINKSKSSVDGIYWTAKFYNNSGDLLKTEESSFNSGGLIDPIASGFSKSVARMPKVKGASKVRIEIDRVHFVIEGNCP